MATQNDIAYAGCVFVSQAGPLTVEVKFPDATDPSHGVLIFEDATKALAYYEMDATYTSVTRLEVSAQKWGTHSLPTDVDILHPDQRIIDLLKQQVRLSEDQVKRLENTKYRRHLLSLLEDFTHRATKKMSEANRPLTFAEVSAVWEGIDSHAKASVRMEHSHAEADLRRLLAMAEEEIHAVERTKLSVDDGNTLLANQLELKQQLEALTATIAALTAQRGNGATFDALPTQPTAPAGPIPPPTTLAPAASAGTTSVLKLSPFSGVTSDCRTWHLLRGEESSFQNVKRTILDTLGIVPAHITNKDVALVYQLWSNEFDTVTSVFDMADSSNKELFAMLNFSTQVLITRIRYASGLVPASSRVQGDLLRPPMALQWFKENEAALGSKYVPAPKSRSFKNFKRAAKNGGGAGATGSNTSSTAGGARRT